MGICATELREFVIRPTLEHLDSYSLAAENLLLATAAQESGLGFHLRQDSGERKGLGIYQINEDLHNDIWDNYLALDADLASTVRGIASQHDFLKQPHAELATNLTYSTAIAWLIYRRANVVLPSDCNMMALADCWLKFYPTIQENPSAEHFTSNVKFFIGPETGIAA
ncbi:MAG: hypothetical protein COB04_04040 [Gammaproteobacteria bacterium]|nr:MAG: hypothetical protein COB04_04040 [Gammaproteobacteria bacterium]